MKTLVILAALCASAAMAANPPAPRDDVSRTQADVQTVFAAIDRDRDDRISKAEAARAKTLRHRFAAVDSSGDGFLSRAEYMARPRDEPFE